MTADPLRHEDLKIINNIINLSKRLPVEVFRDGTIFYDVHSYDNSYIRLLKKTHFKRIDKKHFSLTAFPTTSGKNMECIRKTDVTVGVWFPDIKEGQKVILNINKYYYETFVPNSGKLRVALDNGMCIFNRLSLYSTYDYKIMNSNGTEDNGQEFYIIGAYLNETLSKKILHTELAVMCTFTKAYRHRYAALGTIYNINNKDRAKTLYKANDNTYLFRLKWAVMVVGSFLKYNKNMKKIMRERHKQEWQYVMAELECMPNFGVVGIEAVKRLNMTYHNTNETFSMKTTIL